MYIPAKALSITKRVELIKKKEFVVAALNLEDGAFVILVTFIVNTSSNLVHLSCRAEIALLKANEVPTAIPSEWTDFTDIFSLEMVAELLEYTKIYDHAIQLIDSNKPSYKAIYNLRLLKLRTLKTYIETNLVKSFIRLSRSLINALIIFIQKSDSNFLLCINYQGLNNLTIKKWYPLPLIGESLDRLD